MDRNNILPEELERRLVSCGFQNNDDEYMTYTDAWQWIWDNTPLKIYPKEYIDGTISMCWIRPLDGTEDILAFGYDKLSEAMKGVITYVIAMGLVESFMNQEKTE